MFDPRVESLASLSDTELHDKLVDLNRKYWMTHNPEVQLQIANIAAMYQTEQQSRAIKAMQPKDDEEGLDSLINIS